MKILASSASMDSAVLLRDFIEKILGLEHKAILVSSTSEACAGHDVILRYGCGYGKLEKEPVWGNKDFSNLCIDKARTSALLADLVTTPVFESKKLPKDFPVLIRETLTGAQSTGVHLVHNEDEFLQNWKTGFVWTKYFKHTFEIRVNAVFQKEGVSMIIYKKVPNGAATEASLEEFIPGDGGADNCKWLRKDNNYYKKVYDQLLKIKDRIMENGGTFVGIDMIYVPELEDYVILELNSGPWLTKYSAEWLANIFVKAMKDDYGKVRKIKYPVKVGKMEGETGNYWIVDASFDIIAATKEQSVADTIAKALNKFKE